MSLTEALATIGQHLESQGREIEQLKRQLTATRVTPAQIRMEAGLTAEQLAERAGVSRPTVYRIEDGKFNRAPSGTIQKLATALNRPDYIAAVIGNRKT